MNSIVKIAVSAAVAGLARAAAPLAASAAAVSGSAAELSSGAAEQLTGVMGTAASAEGAVTLVVSTIVGLAVQALINVFTGSKSNAGAS